MTFKLFETILEGGIFINNHISKANKITLNAIQKALSVTVPKTNFLKMIFPESVTSAPACRGRGFLSYERMVLAR